MRLSKDQTDLLADYFADLSKIIFGSVVVAFFLPTTAGPIALPVWIVGVALGIGGIILSIKLAK